MNRILQILSVIFFIVVSVPSCSTEHDEISTESDFLEDFSHYTQQFTDYISNNNPDFSDFLTFVETNISEEGLEYEIKDSILYIRFPHGYTYFYDKYGKTTISINESIDTLGINKIWSELEKESAADTCYTSKEYGSETKSTINNEIRCLHNKSIYYLHLGGMDNWPYLKSMSQRNGKEIFKLKTGSKLNNIKDAFKNNDIVILQCHGDSNGCMVIPQEHIDISKLKFKPKCCGTIVNYITLGKKQACIAYTISKEEMESLFPEDMSSSILWTIMCYSGNKDSAIFEIASKRNIVEFYGATNIITADCLKYLVNFIPKFFRYAYDSKSAFYNAEDGSGVKYRYFDKNKNKTIDGIYIRRGNKLVYSIEGTAEEAIEFEENSLIRLYKRIPGKLLSLIESPTRSISSSNGGIAITNFENGKTEYLTYDQIDNLKYNIHQHNEFATINMSFNATDIFEEGLKYYYQLFAKDKDSNIFTYGERHIIYTDQQLRNKLIKLYKDTNGDDWYNNTNWCSDRPIDQWYGISKTIDDYYNICLDNNNLSGNFQIRNCDEIRDIDIKNNKINSVTIENCENIKEIQCSDNLINSINVDNCRNLQYLSCYNCKLIGIQIEKCNNIANIHCADNNITSLDLTSCPNLIKLGCSNNQISNLDLSTCNKLKDIYCNNNNIERINLNSCNQLRDLDCSNNLIKILDLSGCTYLERINCSNNQIHTFNLDTNNKNLRTLNCENNQICHKLDLSNQEYLSIAYYNNNNITDLDLSGCISLRTINCSMNSVKNIKLSNCLSVESISIENVQIEEIDASGLSSLEDFLLVDCENLKNINLSDCIKLDHIWIQSPAVKRIDISNCESIKEYTYLAHAYVDGRQSLEEFYAARCSSLKSLNINNTFLRILNVSECTELESLICSNNMLTSLNLDSCISLKKLWCHENHIIQEITPFYDNLSLFAYDNLYQYYENGHYSRKQYGWYYKGEPERGYHRKN